ncbi:hypothetical protein F2981_18405 (plasmid) [Sinorhizobium meliloti]|nr:hypothetical protein [Sinorhizobium meliloti]
MKITKLTTYIVPPRWLFLKIETDEGVVGVGRARGRGARPDGRNCRSRAFGLSRGQGPLSLMRPLERPYAGGFYRGGAIHMSALAGIDQALWDIKGKALGQPVHSLLGGPVP